MKTFVQRADEAQDFIAPANVTSGTGVKIGDILVIALETKLSGERFRGMTQGVVSHAKVSAQAWTQGQRVLWDDTAKLFTTVTTGNFIAAASMAVFANPTAVGSVYLYGVSLGAAQA